MRKFRYILFVISLFPAFASAWWDWTDAYMGPNMSRIYSFYSNNKYFHYKPGFSLGYYANFKSKNKIGYQAGIMVQNSGLIYSGPDHGIQDNAGGTITYPYNITARFSLYSIIIPVNMVIPVFKKDKVYAGIFAGRYIASFERDKVENAAQQKNSQFAHIYTNTSPYHFGLNIGFGHEFTLGAHKLYLKLSNATGMQFPKPTITRFSPVSNCLTLHLGYVFGE